MRPILRRAVIATACLSALVLAGCGKHVASNAPITFAPADTPYLVANFKSAPADVTKAWSLPGNLALSMDIQQLGTLASKVGEKHPTLAKVLQAVQAELANVHDDKDLVQATGFSRSALFAIYGVGDAPVVRVELASPDAFKAFWDRVEKRAGVATPTATLAGQAYRVVGGNDVKLHMLVALEGKQLVVTFVPANASQDMLKQLLGVTRPASNASDRLARINSEHGYGDFGSGYLDLPRLFANLFDGKDPVTAEFAKDLGGSLTDPACASEFASLARQAPLISFGRETYTAKEARYSVDMQLAPALQGALATLRQPVAGMDQSSDASMFDMVLALPLQKWQAFIRDRARAAAAKTYQCRVLQPLNRFAQLAANPPVQMPPQAASLLGARVVLDKFDTGPQLAGRLLVASSDPAGLARMIQQTLPQFALKTINTDGKPVAFPLPPRAQGMLGGTTEGWIAADQHSIVAGFGVGEDAKLADALNAPAGDGSRLMRMHLDGRMYGIFASWMGRFAAMVPAAGQSRMQQAVSLFQEISQIIASADMDVKLDDNGLHFETLVTHR